MAVSTPGSEDPQAVGEVFLWWVIAFLLHSPFLALLSFIYIPIFMMTCFAEEQDLLWRYGDNYVEYYQRTGAFFQKSTNYSFLRKVRCSQGTQMNRSTGSAEKIQPAEDIHRTFPLPGTTYYNMLYDAKSKKKFYNGFKFAKLVARSLIQAAPAPINWLW